MEQEHINLTQLKNHVYQLMLDIMYLVKDNVHKQHVLLEHINHILVKVVVQQPHVDIL